MGRTRKNPVAEAIERVGGALAAARLCGVTPACIHQWRALGRVRLAVSAIKLAQRSGIPVEQIAGLEDVAGAA